MNVLAQTESVSTSVQSEQDKDREIAELKAELSVLKKEIASLKTENTAFRKALSDALDKLTQELLEKRAANEALEAGKQAVADAKAALSAGKMTMDAYDRVVLIADKAIAMYEKGVKAYEVSIDAQIKVIMALSSALVTAEAKTAAANKRGVFMSIISFVAGVVSGRRF